MTFSLLNHHRGYQIRATDLLLSLGTGFSGAPYAMRHYDLSSGRLGQKLLCAIEFMPVLGGVVAIIELIAASIWSNLIYLIYGRQFLSVPWRAELLSVEKGMEKMHRNARKAIIEHGKKSSAFVSVRSGLHSLEKMGKVESTPLKLNCHFADEQGERKTMEDAHIFKKIEQGTLAAVFDGHAGSEVSKYASKEFEKRFSTVLKACEGNVHQAFEILIHEIHQEVAQKSSWNGVGSTAVICFIDPKTHLIYTATVGDSEAFIQRGRSIPLSVVHDFTSKHDAKRLEDAMGVPGYVAKCIKEGDGAKDIRSPKGCNVSRAFGDVDDNGVIIHKPTITVQKLYKGDKIRVVCDGVTDYVPEDVVCAVIDNTRKGENPARNLVRCAIKDYKSQDNVTALVVEVA